MDVKSNDAGMKSALPGGNFHEGGGHAAPAGHADEPRPKEGGNLWSRPGHWLPKLDVAGSNPVARCPLPTPLPGVSVSFEPADVYRQWPEINASSLKELSASSVGFYERIVAGTAPAKSGDALSYGSLLHEWGEVGEANFWDRLELCPAKHLTAAGAFSKSAEEWRSTLAAGVIPITPADKDKLWKQTRQILANSAAAELIESSIAREFNIRWRWDDHQMKCRIDGATPEVFYDFKTCRDAKPLETFWRSVGEWQYDLQCAVYENAMVAAGWEHRPMHFIVTSTTWPHHCSVVTLPPTVTEVGRIKAIRLLAELKQRREWDSWSPADYGRVVELQCPQFMSGGSYE